MKRVFAFTVGTLRQRITEYFTGCLDDEPICQVAEFGGGIIALELKLEHCDVLTWDRDIYWTKCYWYITCNTYGVFECDHFASSIMHCFIRLLTQDGLLDLDGVNLWVFSQSILSNPFSRSKS